MKFVVYGLYQVGCPTIVGESPATVPQDIGVFVVEKGKAKAKATE